MDIGTRNGLDHVFRMRATSPRWCWLPILILWAFVGRVSGAPIEWQTLPGGRRASLVIPEQGRTGFTEISPAKSGIQFTNHLSEDRSLTNQIFLNGSGVAAGDVDGDGRVDLYFCGLDTPNALYRNLGDWRFEEVTVGSGTACADQASTGAALADMDGDGDLDLLVNGVARGTRLFLNDGRGKFQDVTAASGLQNTSGSASLALADVDGDGRLDVYVVNYRNDTLRDLPDTRFRFGITNGVSQLLTVNGRPASSPELAGRYSFSDAGGVLENGEMDVLYHNDGDGRFTAVSWSGGAFLDENGAPMRPPYDWGLSAMFRDLNGDGAPDLYVCNDFQSPDRCWINDGKGRFHALARRALRQTSLFSMGVDFADIDRDGRVDFFVADMLSRDHGRRQVQIMGPTAFAQVRHLQGDRPQFPRNTLFWNRGDDSFAEIAQYSGVDASDWSWCPVFLDVDLDGYEDLLITTGHWRDAQNADVAQEIEDEKRRRALSPLAELRLRGRFSRLDTPNVAFRNRQDRTFEEVGRAWGFDSRRISHGMALADLDGDGDLDGVVNCLNDAPLLLRNESVAARVSVRLRGRSPNTRGIGARLRIQAAGLPVQTQEMTAAGRYLSSDETLRTFAAGSSTNRVTIEVTWRSGRQTVLREVAANSICELDESEAAPAPSAPSPVGGAAEKRTPFFADVSRRLNHGHVDEAFDDLARQPLLPRRLSTLGPGVTWFDFNGDGWEDLFIGAGKGGRLAVFRNDRQGGFVPQRAKAFETPMTVDLTSVLAWKPTLESSDLLMGLAAYESEAAQAPGLRRFSMNTGEADEALLTSSSSTGPMAMADADADGDLDLFVGGRVLPGRYPENPDSWFFRNQNGRLERDVAGSRPLAGVGMVSGALFADLDGDGIPELVLAGDWAPLRIWQFRSGNWVPTNPPIRWAQASGRDAGRVKPGSLEALTGWWNSVAAGDFDNDGRLDLVAGNWGRNHAQSAYLAAPLEVHFGSRAESEVFALIEVRRDPGMAARVPVRDLMMLGQSFPELRERFPTFAAFGRATWDELERTSFSGLKAATAAVLDSLLLLNRGDHWEARPLPPEAQWSPVFGLVVGDWDGDGNQDAFLAQNFFGVTGGESRQDAGRGLWLRGDGRGGWSAVSAAESGLEVIEEGRGAARCDFDHDGRLDLVVGQNRAATKLYHNLRARPGVRLRLVGGPQNPQAVGARVRALDVGGRWGPVQEIQLGGGYWSQDATELLLTSSDVLAAVEIRWPNGVRERVELGPQVREVSRMQPASGAEKRP